MQAVDEHHTPPLPPEIFPRGGPSVGLHLRTGEADVLAREKHLGFNRSKAASYWGLATAPAVLHCAETAKLQPSWQ